MKFNEKLQKLRKENKMSQEQLADLLDVSRQAVSKWESGTTYPEMDKLLMLCKIFKCTLDELTNDDISDITLEEKEEKKKKNWLNIILEYINKTIHMIKRMSFQNIVSMIIKMLLVFIFLAALCIPVYGLYLLGSGLFSILGYGIGSVLSKIWLFLLAISYAVLAVTIFFYTFKIQYLDVYDTDNTSTMKNENDEEIVEESSKVQIVYRNAPTSSIFQLFGKLCTYLFKSIIFFVSIPFFIFFVFLFVALILMVYCLFSGIIYIGFLSVTIFSILLTFVIIKFLMEVLFSRKTNFSKMFRLVMVSIAGIGISIGICLFEIANSSFYNTLPNNVEEKVISKTVPYRKDLYLWDTIYYYKQHFYTDSRTVHYEEDNTLTDSIRIEVSYINGFQNPEIIVNTDNGVNEVIVSTNEQHFNFKNIILEDLRNKEFHNYDLLYDIKITVYGNKNTLNLIQEELKNRKEQQELSELESCREENRELREKLNTNYSYEEIETELNQKDYEIEILKEQNEQMQEELIYYKETLQELINH